MVEVYTEFSRPLLAAAAAAVSYLGKYLVMDKGGLGAHDLYYLCPGFGTALSIYRLGSRERTHSHACIPNASAQR